MSLKFTKKSLYKGKKLDILLRIAIAANKAHLIHLSHYPH